MSACLSRKQLIKRLNDTASMLEAAAVDTPPAGPLLFAESEEFRDLAFRLTYSAKGASDPPTEAFVGMAWWETEILMLKLKNDRHHPVLLMRLAKEWLKESVARIQRLAPEAERMADGL